MNRRYGELKFLAERNFYQYDGIRIHLAIKEEGKIFIPKALEWEEKERGAWAPEFLMMSDTEAQALMDSLYDCGYRPTRVVESAGQVEAIKYHLEDMRRLVFVTDGKEVK